MSLWSHPGMHYDSEILSVSGHCWKFEWNIFSDSGDTLKLLLKLPGGGCPPPPPLNYGWTVLDLFLFLQIGEEIRHVLDAYDQTVPAVLEIPSKEHPYDPSKDSILRRARVTLFIVYFHSFFSFTNSDHNAIYYVHQLLSFEGKNAHAYLSGIFSSILNLFTQCVFHPMCR